MILQIIVSGLIMGCVYGVIALGYSNIYKASGLMSLVQGDMLMLGAFIGLTLFKSLKVPIIPTLFITMAAMFVIGWLVEQYAVTKLLDRGAQFAYIMLLTLAIGMVFQNGAMLIWSNRTEYAPPIFGVSTISIGSFVVPPESLLVIAIAIAMMILLALFLKKTKFGVSMRAAALDQIAANAMGINVPLTKGITWGISAAMAGGVGVVLGPLWGVSASMGIIIGQKGFASAVAGGYGNMYGAIIGGLFFGMMEQFVTAYVSSTYKDLVSFGVLIIVLTIMPTGIFKAKILE